MLAVTNSIELQSNTAQSALAQVSNVMVRVEKNKTAVKNRREATFLPLQIAKRQGTQEITQTEVEVHDGEAGEVELGVPMAD